MKSPMMYLAVLVGLLSVIVILSLGVGAVAIPPEEVIRTLGTDAGSDQSVMQSTIIWELRLPRILLAGVVGAALGTAGAGYQGLFRNPLADPFVDRRIERCRSGC